MFFSPSALLRSIHSPLVNWLALDSVSRRLRAIWVEIKDAPLPTTPSLVKRYIEFSFDLGSCPYSRDPNNPVDISRRQWRLVTKVSDHVSHLAKLAYRFIDDPAFSAACLAELTVLTADLAGPARLSLPGVPRDDIVVCEVLDALSSTVPCVFYYLPFVTILERGRFSYVKAPRWVLDAMFALTVVARSDPDHEDHRQIEFGLSWSCSDMSPAVFEGALSLLSTDRDSPYYRFADAVSAAKFLAV